MKRNIHSFKQLFAIFFIAALFTGCKKANSVSTGITVINEGVSGNTASSLLARLNDVFNQHPDLVIVMIGTNDCYSNGPDYQNYVSNIDKLIDDMQSKSINILLVTPPPIPVNNINGRVQRLDTLCNKLDSISTARNTLLVDIHTEFANVVSKSPDTVFYFAGQVHPTAAGYSSIGTLIAASVNAHFSKKNKIVCFGDSITYGLEVTGAGTATGETYPAVLQRALNNN